MFPIVNRCDWQLDLTTNLVCGVLILVFIMPPSNIVWPEAYRFCPLCACVRPCVHRKTLLTRYIAEYLTHFHQTFISDELLDRDECVTIWGQKIKGQGYDGIKYAGNSTFLTWCLEKSISQIFTIFVRFLPNLHQWCFLCIMGQRWMH